MFSRKAGLDAPGEKPYEEKRAASDWYSLAALREPRASPKPFEGSSFSGPGSFWRTTGAEPFPVCLAAGTQQDGQEKGHSSGSDLDVHADMQHELSPPHGARLRAVWGGRSTVAGMTGRQDGNTLFSGRPTGGHGDLTHRRGSLMKKKERRVIVLTRRSKPGQSPDGFIASDETIKFLPL